MIPEYPEFKKLTLDDRPLLHPLLRGSAECLSEHSFANLYLFRSEHDYAVSLANGVPIVAGSDNGRKFFMLPAGLPEKGVLDALFSRFTHVKNAPEKLAATLSGMGCRAEEDRDNFDYLYMRRDLASLTGRRLHKKKNLFNLFSSSYDCAQAPLEKALVKDALKVLDEWLIERGYPGDYDAAKEGLILMDELELTGSLYYIDERPVAYIQGELLPGCSQYAVHFEKGLLTYRGLREYVNQTFASNMSETVKYINREQDLGDPLLRQSKEGYRPCGFNKKFRVYSGAEKA
jgi:hypothetical protein